MALQFAGILKKIYSGADTARARRWVAADYIDRVLFASPSVAPLFWPGSGSARPIPGLPDSDGYDGVEVFDNHVLLWRESTLKWSDRNDFGLWIPVAITAAAGSAVLESDLILTATGTTTTAAYLTELAGEFVSGQFVRMVSYETDPTAILYDYFRVRQVALEPIQSITSIKRPQTAAASAKTRIYLDRYSSWIDWTTGARLKINGVSTQLKITDRSRNANYDFPTTGISPVVPEIGGKLVMPFARVNAEMQASDTVSVGPSADPGQDLYEITDPPSYSVTMRRLGIGDKASGTLWPSGTIVSFQNWVEVENVGSSDVAIPGEATVSVLDSLILEPLGFTGGTAPGAKIPAGTAVETINANASGEVLNVGSTINGDIFGCVTLAEYCYILKKRSIQSMQSVGPASGTFFIRPEILDEGPIGRYAWCRAGDREIALIGNKGMYLYGGGQNLRPFAIQHWEDFRDEVDWARSDEIVAHHHRRDNEVWFVYPTKLGETKCFVFNYVENSVVLDRYPSQLNGITALGRVDWELAPTWESLDVTERCNGAAKRWYEYVDEPEREYTVMAAGGDTGNKILGEDPNEEYPRLLVYGRVWSRSSNDDCNPTAIASLAETPDFDFGDPTLWKYVDTVFVILNGKQNVPEGAVLTVTVGARDNLNSPIRWSEPQELSITEAGSGPTKINATVSGRYLRLRFASETVGANWGITAYHITARRGGTY